MTAGRCRSVPVFKGFAFSLHSQRLVSLCEQFRANERNNQSSKVRLPLRKLSVLLL